MNTLLLNGEDMIARCNREGDARHMRESLNKLKDRWTDTTRKAKQRKVSFLSKSYKGEKNSFQCVDEIVQYICML